MPDLHHTHAHTHTQHTQHSHTYIKTYLYALSVSHIFIHSLLCASLSRSLHRFPHLHPFRTHMHATSSFPFLSPFTKQVNPFRVRICKVFSEDGQGRMSFEDFLDCMSVFSEGATRDVKASYAFRLYGELPHFVCVCVCVCVYLC